MFQTNVKVTAVKNTKRGNRMIDYYLIMPDGTTLYLVTSPYVHKCYDLCKGSVRLNDLLKWKDKNKGVMKLVDCMKRMSSYLQYEFDAA